MNLDEKTQDLIYKASNFHDLGKIGIPDNILLKPASLENSEWETMKTHTSIGYEILKNSKSDYLRAGGIIAFTHHEKYDGSGYPNGLKGENIPLMGRIVAIADVFDALMSKRPYKDPWTLEMSKEYLINAKGIHFDPRLIELFMENILSVTEIMNTIKD
jgi:putative two-component system response regulator